MEIKDIVNSLDPHADLALLLEVLHKEGPSDPAKLEYLSYYKRFHQEVFLKFEGEIISALGLFYKNRAPNNVYSFLMSGFGERHKSDYGSYLTPVQASIRRAVDNSQFISISAPTSAGKSYSIRDFIAGQKGDAVVVVPSRALIAEYVNSMKRKFEGDKNVMVSPFVDRVFTSRNLRRIFILTPERSRDLYPIANSLNIEVFFFDEAQMSEEQGRGVIFDVMVRRVRRNFSNAKLIFAHPFVDNPGAQFLKHGIETKESFSKTYNQGAVGRISVFQNKKNLNDYYFSPYAVKGYHLKKCVQFPESFEKFAFNGEHTILVYVSKSSIYKWTFIDAFKEYIDEFDEITSQEALKIIDTIKGLLGSDNDSQVSDMVGLLKKGVVIHHGSVPLKVRFLVEDFIRGGFSKICFATSTLAQGINMPFDIVWLESSRFLGENDSDRALSFKNLIGRAGRLSDDTIFDFGYVYTKNAVSFSEKINSSYTLQESSLIDDPSRRSDADNDSEELLLAIRNDTFDEDANLPRSKVERLSDDHVLDSVKSFLDIVYAKSAIREAIGGHENRQARKLASNNLQAIFEASLGRSLFEGESAVFDTAIKILFLTIQGYSFREIAGLRFSQITRRDEGGIGGAVFSQPANKLPDSKLMNKFSLFNEDTPARNVRFDAIIYDTYDYLDTVISFSLADVFSAAFKIYLEKTGDDRAGGAIELLRYGTNDSRNILLMRYGFPPEDVPLIAPYIESISELNIVFNDKVKGAPQYIEDMIEWYLPQ
ncbi:MAG: helicase [Gammaproteobacteria bacterium 28-57-27]|nr:MAG: helicase [Gammaproteobacteria bacterium 28-57-27]